MKERKILVFGNSSFVKRRVLPALDKNKKLSICICSFSSKKNLKKKVLFNNLNESLKTFKPDIVYISKINSLHFKFAKIILKKGYNTIVDKPITLDLQKTKELINIAKLKKVLLAEATLFNYHRFIKTLNKICKTPKNIEHIYSVFNIPMPKSLNQISKTKGDCESDMAPYAASIIRLYLGKRNIRINVSKNYFKKTKIVKNFYIMASSNKKTYFGNFAFGKEYIQKIIFYTKEKIVYSPERIFAPPPEMSGNITIKSKNKTKKIKVKKDDCIENFFKIVFNALNLKSYNYFYSTLLIDSKLRERIKRFY